MSKMIVNLRDIDITRKPYFKEYVAYKKDLKFETENRSFLQVYMPPEAKKQHQEISDAIAQTPTEEIRKKADELITAQNNQKSINELVDHMASKNVTNYEQFSSMWSPIAWQARENNDNRKVIVDGKVISGADLGFIIASSLQQIDASQDPITEYYTWCERQQKIEVDINTNGTTEDEIIARNVFIHFLDDRETEIKRVITLYAGSALNSNSRLQELAQEKIKFLVFKLNELRRLRERTASTKAYADVKEKTEEETSKENTISLSDAAALGTIGAISLGAKRLNSRMAYLPDYDISDGLLRMRPETTTKDEAYEKIRLAQEHYDQTVSMLTAMRNGMTKDEWLETIHKNNCHSCSHDTCPSACNLHGWEISRFKEYCNE